AGAGAEVCAKQEASGKRAVPGRSLNTYSWQEVQRHNREADQWLVIDRKVYSVTGWADRHPGGRRVLKHYAGEDATDAFRAVHLDLDLVQLYLKPLLFGELAAGEPSQERNKNLSEVNVSSFYMWRSSSSFKSCFNANLGVFFLHLARVLTLEVLAWLILYQFGSGWRVTILISFLLTISQQDMEKREAWHEHDKGHCSTFKKSKWNHLLHKFVMGHLKETVSKGRWDSHQRTETGSRPQVTTAPRRNMLKILVLTRLDPLSTSVRWEKCFPMHSEMPQKKEQIEILGGIPFTSCLKIHMFWSLHNKRTLLKTNHETSVYILYFCVILKFKWIPHSLFIYPPGSCFSLRLYFWIRSYESLCSMSHSMTQQWGQAQVLAICNIEQSFFNDRFTGHVTFHIKHHLFPTMPRHNYHKVAPLMRSLCAKHRLRYVNNPMLKAFGDIPQALKKSTALWKEAYYET
uniref:Cytochrome b5 heme-binding domain-containing protein n=1 Tax=Otolemur garnettii TaxID=30611 RepID=H0XYB0_OTOGA